MSAESLDYYDDINNFFIDPIGSRDPAGFLNQEPIREEVVDQKEQNKEWDVQGFEEQDLAQELDQFEEHVMQNANGWDDRVEEQEQEPLMNQHPHYPVQINQNFVYGNGAQLQYYYPQYPQLHPLLPPFQEANQRVPGPLKRGAAVLQRARPYTQNPRPFLSYLALCAMAIHNSPSGYVTSSDVYEFILHHFPHFKDVNPNWKNTVRNALSLKKQFFKAIGADPASKGLRYALVEGVVLEQCFNNDCWNFMKEKDERTFAYYTRILQGQDGFLWNRQAAKQRAREGAKQWVEVLQTNGPE